MWRVTKTKKNKFESKLLKLNSQKAYDTLKWKCILTTNQTISLVTEWYKFYLDNNKNDMYGFSIEQIKKFEDIIKKN